MKKLVKYIFVAGLVLLCSAKMVAATPTYTITQTGQADVTGNFTTWAAFMDVLNAHALGTKDNRVTATISGAAIANTGRPDIQGWTEGFLFNSDTFAYTTLIFDNCEFNFSRRSAFQRSSYPGNILRFNHCTLGANANFWGINEGQSSAGGYYAYDFEFYDCDINSNSLGAGGVWYGDVTIVDCKVLQINMNCGNSDASGDNRFQNSFRDPSTLTVKNVTFKNTEPGDRGIYANTFNKYVYQKASSDNHLYSFKTNGYHGDEYFQQHPEDFHYELINQTGNIEYTHEGIYSGFYLLTGYAVKYYANKNNDDKESALDPKCYLPGEKAAILGNSFTYSGHAFTGWNTKANGSGTDYAEGAVVEIPFYILKLYAQWGEAPAVAAINIKCTGLKDGESALFKVKRDNVVANIINITGGQDNVKTIEDLSEGCVYTVSPDANWSWSYDIVLSKKTSEPTEDGVVETYEYTATKKDSIKTKNAESIKDNEMTTTSAGGRTYTDRDEPIF